MLYKSFEWRYATQHNIVIEQVVMRVFLVCAISSDFYYFDGL